MKWKSRSWFFWKVLGVLNKNQSLTKDLVNNSMVEVWLRVTPPVDSSPQFNRLQWEFKNLRLWFGSRAISSILEQSWFFAHGPMASWSYMAKFEHFEIFPLKFQNLHAATFFQWLSLVEYHSNYNLGTISEGKWLKLLTLIYPVLLPACVCTFKQMWLKLLTLFEPATLPQF